LLTECRKRVADTVRVEIGQTGRSKCLPENRSHRCCVAPVPAGQANSGKLLVGIKGNFGGGEERNIKSKQPLMKQIFNPFSHGLADLVADREEYCAEGF